MMKILLYGMKDDLNLGDSIINDCTEFLVKKVLQELDIVDYVLTSIDMRSEQYSEIKSSDLIIFTGGGLIKYKYQGLYSYLDKITLLADEAGVPVVFNAVGVEGYDNTDDNCKVLMCALNRKCVKQITTRDDLTVLRDKYITNKTIKVAKVADSAVWVDEVYGIEKSNHSRITGLGVLREGIFSSNGIDFGLAEQLQLWEGIIAELEKRNEDWMVFTNGWPSDTKFAINLFKHLKREDEMAEKLVPQPQNAHELVNIISKFKGVIAGRLHANIVSYSLNIPSIGLVWNEKCALWGENIGFPERFFRHDSFNGKNIVDEYLKALDTGYNEESRESYKLSTYNSLYEIINSLLIS